MSELFRHFKMYKPYGILSQVHLQGYKNKKGLSEVYDFPPNVHPIGRLDEDSEGLLLMSSNSKFMAFVNGSGIEKEYHVQLDGDITPEAIKQLVSGVEIVVNGVPYLTKTCKVFKLLEEPGFEPRFPPTRAGKHRPWSWISISICEGKHRQVRKMTAAVGFPTLRLIRVRIGNIKLNEMKPGEVLELPTIVPL